MAISKVVYGGETIVDLTGDTVTADKLLEGVTAHGKNGEQITGNVPYEDHAYSMSPSSEETRRRISLKYASEFEKRVIGDGKALTIYANWDKFGDAAAADVAKGKTFTSAAGYLVEGTMESVGTDTSDATATAADMAAGKTAYVNGEKITGTVKTYDTQVGWSDRVPSATSDNTVSLAVSTSTPYLLRKGVILSSPLSNFGDATAADVAKGKTFTSTAGLKVTGTMEAGGGNSNNNCEAYHITSKTATITPKSTGTVKVWGYGFYSQGTYQRTQYSFVGDGYYSGTSYGNPTKTSATFSIGSDGTLQGLPSNVSTVDLLVTIGI